MGTWLGGRLTFANVVSVIALFIALGAGTYAAGLAPNSVKSRHIVNGQVKNADLASDAIASENVKPDALGGQDISEGSLDLSNFGYLPGQWGMAPYSDATRDDIVTFPGVALRVSDDGDTDTVKSILLEHTGTGGKFLIADTDSGGPNGVLNAGEDQEVVATDNVLSLIVTSETSPAVSLQLQCAFYPEYGAIFVGGPTPRVACFSTENRQH